MNPKPWEGLPIHQIGGKFQKYPVIQRIDSQRKLHRRHLIGHENLGTTVRDVRGRRVAAKGKFKNVWQAIAVGVGAFRGICVAPPIDSLAPKGIVVGPKPLGLQKIDLDLVASSPLGLVVDGVQSHPVPSQGVGAEWHRFLEELQTRSFLQENGGAVGV